MATTLDTVLKDHGLRKTAFRKELLDLFRSSNSSLTVDEIRVRAGNSADKVTVYRALEAFEKSGLIHRVPDKDNLTRYALCHSECSSHNHVHNHAHFICNICNETYCIDGVQLPEIKELNGFQIASANVTLEGNCPNCVTA